MSKDGEADRATHDKTRVFISYSRRNMAFANRLEAALRTNGFEPLIDREGIYAFEDWWKRIEALIAQADTVVFAVSPESVSSEVCAKEVAYAAGLNKRFAPVVVQRVEDRFVPEALARLNFIFFDDEAEFDENMKRLVEALSTDIGWIRQHTEFGEAARAWDASGRPTGLLLRSPRLEESERWIAARPAGAPAPTEITQAFVVASRAGASRRRNILTGSLGAGLVVALGLAGYASWQRSVAVEQQRYAENALDAGIKTSNDVALSLAERLRNQAGLSSAVVKYLLDSGVALQQKLASFGHDTPELRGYMARALLEVGITRSTIGDDAGAYAALDQARKIFESLLPAQPNNADMQINLSVAYGRMSNVLRDEGKNDDALAASRKAVEIAQKVVAGRASAAATLAAEDALAEADISVGDTLSSQGKPSDALAAYQASLAVSEKLSADAKGDLPLQSAKTLGGGYERVGRLLLATGKTDQALAAFKKALTVFEGLAGKNPDDTDVQRDLSVANDNMGNVTAASGKLDDALAFYRKALAVRKKLADSDPGDVLWMRDVAIDDYLIATVLTRKGQLDDALTAYAQGVAIERKLAAKDPGDMTLQSDIALSEIRTGDILKTQGKLDEALQVFSDGAAAVQRLRKDHPDQPMWADFLRQQGVEIAFVAYRYLFAHQFSQSLTASELAISLAPDLVWINAHRAHALMFLGRTEEARALYLRFRTATNVFGDSANPVSWRQFVLQEFAELSKAGLTNPLMAQIQQQLGGAD